MNKTTGKVQTRTINPVSLCILCALLLSAIMAATSGAEVNPDEIHHLEAVRYYTNHFLPPAIGDPEVRGSYSVWGISYLNYNWIEYLILGKISALLSLLFSDPLLAARFANLLVFASACAYFVARFRHDQAALIPTLFMLITPQIWYVFSYVNNDGFALVIASLLAYQAASPMSVTASFLSGGDGNYRKGLLFGVLLGLQLICKSNYWPLAAVTVLWLVFRGSFSLLTVRRLAFVCGIATIIVVVRIGADLAVNGETNFAGASYVNYVLGDTRAATKLRAYQEQIAEPRYRPSVMESNLDETDPGVKLREKGVSLLQMFTVWNWHVLTFCSFVGVYGYMNLWGPKLYYGAMAVLYFGLVVFLFASVIRAHGKRAVADISIASAGLFLTLAASVAVSWTYSFQPQGRYLFPCIPILAIFTITNREVISARVIRLIVFAMFALSVYSFVFVGLVKLRG